MSLGYSCDREKCLLKVLKYTYWIKKVKKKGKTIMWGLLAWIVLGLIAGAIAKAIYGHQGGGIVATIVLGILGALVGGWLGGTFFQEPVLLLLHSDFDPTVLLYLQFLVRSSSCLCGVWSLVGTAYIEILGYYGFITTPRCYFGEYCYILSSF